MKRLPEAELELMMIIWEADHPVSRVEIEEKLSSDKKVVPSTILTLLSRLEKRGFAEHKKEGKINYYYAIADKDTYLQEEGQSVLDRMFGSSLKNFVATLYGGKCLDEKDIEELKQFIDEQAGESGKNES